MADMWTVGRALDWTVGYLERKGDGNPRVSAQWLLSAATGLSRIELYTRLDQPLSSDERDVLRDFVSRRGTGEPLQYITGEVGFRHITVKVRRGVLIPRPETEVLVSAALDLLPESTRGVCLPFCTTDDNDDSPIPGECDSLLAVDMCTGGGCIACSLAHERGDVRVIGTDISPEAVALARENVDALGLGDRIDIIECDLGTGIDAALFGRFDLVVSNPPYVPTSVLRNLPREVADFEPVLALDGGEDGLEVFCRIVEFAAKALKPGGVLAVELHETCLDKAARLAQAAGFCDCTVVHDLAGRPRILTARSG